MKTYRVAIVGLGRMGSSIDDGMKDGDPFRLPYSIAACCRASNKLDVVAGVDVLPQRREVFKEKWGVDALYEDYMEMVEKESPDLVAVCTTATGLQKLIRRAPSRDFRGDLHSEMAVRLAEAGVPMLYVEKALACSMEGADAVLQACHKHGTVLNTGVIRRFDSRNHSVRNVIERGEIGVPKAAVSYTDSNTLMHMHIHHLDLISYLLGDPGIAEVRGELRPKGLKVQGNRLDEDPSSLFQVRFADGVDAWSVPIGPYDFEIIGTEGTIRIMNGSRQVVLRKTNLLGRIPQWEEMPFTMPPLESQIKTCLEDLVDAYETGRPSIGNVDVTHQITEACLAVAESHRQGGAWVSLPLQNRDLYVFHV